MLNCDKVWLGRLQLFTQEVNTSELSPGQEEKEGLSGKFVILQEEKGEEKRENKG